MIRKIAHLHSITWDGAGIGHVEQVRLLLAAGADWIQLRQKEGDFDTQLNVARECVHLCRQAGAMLIVNDNVRICRKSHAHGVHLGLLDMPLPQARAVLGPDAIIGGTANTPEQVLQRWREGADYVGLGPWRYTGTKQNLSPVLGDAGVESALLNLREAGAYIPVIVIGGIQPDDVNSVAQLGAHGVAVSSALVCADSVNEKFREFSNALKMAGL